MELPPYPDRQQYVYRPGGGPVIVRRPFAAGFRLAADLELAGNETGVIFAHHNSTKVEVSRTVSATVARSRPIAAQWPCPSRGCCRHQGDLAGSGQ